MQPEEITAYIVEELANYRSPNDIVVALCEKTKMPWSDAEKLVGQVQSDQGREIAARQSPLLIILSVGFLVGGLGVIGLLLLGGVYGIVPLGEYSFQVLFAGIGMTLGGIIGLRNTIAAFLKAK